MALADIRQPSDLRPLTLPQLEALAAEIREFVVGAVSETGVALRFKPWSS